MITLYVFIGLAAFGFMGFFAWSNHKYLMHGAWCKWHKEHHKRDSKKAKMAKVTLNTIAKHFEMNDRFLIMYPTPTIIIMIVGFLLNIPLLIAIGSGVTAYGLTYFIIHNMIIHKRPPLPCLHKMDDRHIRAIARAHLVHHLPQSKTDFSNYGLLIFPTRFF